jgi:type VI secretion system protein ImpK
MNSSHWRLTEGVISYGLELHRQLALGESPDLLREQAMLKDLLLMEDQTARAESAKVDDDSGVGRTAPAAGERFLGIRYALVCWLDELFTTRSAWAHDWNEHKLEVELYGGNDRAWRFWEQARFAQTSLTTDALEVFYLCVALGFRGALTDQPEQLAAWMAAARQRLGQVTEPQWSFPGELAVVAAATPLDAVHRLRQMALIAWVTLLVLAPLTAFFVMRCLNQ